MGLLDLGFVLIWLGAPCDPSSMISLPDKKTMELILDKLQKYGAKLLLGKLYWHPFLLGKLDSLHPILRKWHSGPKFAK